jgi:hypothetical protein
MSQPLIHKIIEDAREIISDSKRWTRNAYARDKNGRPVCPTDPKAVRFCAWGAVLRAAYDLAPQDYMELAHATSDVVGHLDSWPLGRLNDCKNGRRKMIAVFSKALERLRS